jgi:hypothetical protein
MIRWNEIVTDLSGFTGAVGMYGARICCILLVDGK